MTYPWTKWQEADWDEERYEESYDIPCPNCSKVNSVERNQLLEGFECYNCMAQVHTEIEERGRVRATKVFVPKKKPTHARRTTKMSQQLPEMKPVSSSSVSAAGYDPVTEKMYLRFANGSVYEYDDVKQDGFESLMAAPSIGSLIRKLPYAYRKL